MIEIKCISTNTNNTLEFIRDELRNEINITRKQQRDLKINQNRLILGELDNNTSIEEFVVRAAINLRRKSLSFLEYRKLQNALIQNENHVNAFLKVNNVIQGLSRDLASKSIQIKLAAANCCCNLALGNSKTCITLCKFIAPYLIADFESRNQPLVEVCVWTIGNLVSENNNVFCILHAQDCMKSLINLVRQSSDTLLPAVSYACLRYIYSGIDLIKVSDIIKIGTIILVRHPTVLDIDTMWLLAILSSEPECNMEFMKYIFTMCTYFFQAILTDDKNIKKISAILRIICNIISESSGKVAFYLFSNEFERNCIFLKKLLFHQYIHIRQDTLWMLGNLYNHYLDSVQNLVKSMISSLPSFELAINSIN